MRQRPAILDELGRELVRAARADEARGSTAERILGLPRAVVIWLLVLLGLAAVAAAASLVLGRGDPIPIGDAGAVPVELRPAAGTSRLNALDVPDPDGGPAWDVRTSRSQTGAVCATVGQVYDGEFGLLGLDRLFRPLPAGAADTCSVAQPSGATLAGARAFRGGGRFGDVTVVSGVAAAGVRSAVTIAAGRTVRMRLGPDHAFLAVLRGLPEQVLPRLVLTEASGRRTTLRFADTGEFTAPDPSGQSPWRLRYTMGRDGLRCVKAERIPGAGVGSVTVPKHCGPAGQPFVAIRRFVPEVPSWLRPGRGGRRGMGSPATYRWDLHPARTIVWGSVQRAGASVVLTGGGAARRLRVDAGGGRDPLPAGVGTAQTGRGGYLAVLDGHVDPRDLRVTVDGRPVVPGRTYDPIGRPITQPRVPAWRSVAAVARRSRPAPPRVVPRSMSVGRRADDPAGGRPWTLRTWKARMPDVLSRDGRVAACFAVGVEDGGRLVEPLAGAKHRIVGTSPPDASCVEPGRAGTPVAAPEAKTFVDDIASAAPRPVRVVVAGLLGEAARSAQLLGAGAPRPLALGPNGTYLAVLGPRRAGATLRIRAVGRDGVARTSRAALEGFIPGDRCVPLPGQSVRVADPGGGPPWTIGRGRADGLKCRYGARLIAGRPAVVSEERNWIAFGPHEVEILLARNPRPRPRNRPLVVRISDPRFGSQGSTPAPAGVRIARRTLPGRSVITGSASGDVTSLTLRTPRDVRTLRPGPSGLFLAVYDGVFYSGHIHATAHMRDGRTVTQTFPISP